MCPCLVADDQVGWGRSMANATALKSRAMTHPQRHGRPAMEGWSGTCKLSKLPTFRALGSEDGGKGLTLLQIGGWRGGIGLGTAVRLRRIRPSRWPNAAVRSAPSEGGRTSLWISGSSVRRSNPCRTRQSPISMHMVDRSCGNALGARLTLDRAARA